MFDFEYEFRKLILEKEEEELFCWKSLFATEIQTCRDIHREKTQGNL